MTTVTVGTSDFRTALQAVAPHAGDPKSERFHRVRLVVGEQLVTVSASSGFAAAHAIVSVENADRWTGPVTIDITPVNAKEIIQLFKSGNSGDDENPGDLLTLDARGRELVITDTGGLFDGKSLSLPHYGPAEGFPDIAQIIAARLRRGPNPSDRFPAWGIRVAPFAVASKVYAQPLLVEPHGDLGSVVIACGESFLGLIIPSPLSDDDEVKVKEWREAWHRRLPAPDGPEILRHGSGLFEGGGTFSDALHQNSGALGSSLKKGESVTIATADGRSTTVEGTGPDYSDEDLDALGVTAGDRDTGFDDDQVDDHDLTGVDRDSGD